MTCSALRRPGLISALALALVLPAAGIQGAAQSASTAQLAVQVIGLRNSNGVVRLALFDSASAWAADRSQLGAGAVQKLQVPIREGSTTASFAAVPYGTYAIKAFHDEDRSGKFYTGLFGVPKVEVAFSNNVPITKGAASFQQAAFAVKQPYVNLVLRAQKI